MNIPLKIRNEMAKNPYYRFCARSGNDCQGRITWEHAFIYRGKQIQEDWAIIPLCVYHHLDNGLNKELNRYLALCRADIDDLIKRMPRHNWFQQFNYLSGKYGKRKKENKIYKV